MLEELDEFAAASPCSLFHVSSCPLCYLVGVFLRAVWCMLAVVGLACSQAFVIVSLCCQGL